MNNNKIALLVDSCMDLPADYIEQEGVYVVPLHIIYKDHTYTDKVDITSEDVYNQLSKEIPSTSLPSGQTIAEIFEKIISDGYTQLLVATISSGLSGTYNMLNLMSKDYPNLISYVLDTKNIGIGGGLQGVYAYDLIQSGIPFKEIIDKLEKNVSKSHVFFSIPTLEYLAKGGRIGLVSSILGTALNLNPIISCNAEGVYYTVAKARGRKKSIDKMIDIVEKTIGQATNYDLAVAYGNCIEEAKELKERLVKKFPNSRHFFMDEASPALGVHTGPNVLGIAVRTNYPL